MFVFTLGLGFSGYMMSQGNEAFEEIHEICGNLFLVTAIAHVLGIVFHRLRHNECIGASMITGKKTSDTGEGISSNHGLAAIVLVALVGYGGWSLFHGFDPGTRKLNVFGFTMQLGESEDEEGENGEHGEKGEKSEGSKKESGDDDNDDD
jgi:hypothetical protein